MVNFVKQKQIDKIRDLLRKRMDWFDIYEFLHEVGASQKLLSTLSTVDLDAVTQCQVCTLLCLQITDFIVSGGDQKTCSVVSLSQSKSQNPTYLKTTRFSRTLGKRDSRVKGVRVSNTTSHLLRYEILLRPYLDFCIF